MANRYRIRFNAKRCISCHACLVHCKQKNRTPYGVAFNTLSMELTAKDGRPLIKNKYQSCLMCKKPECVAACPRGAIVKREDGLVLLDKERCDGCGQCVAACPFGAMTMLPDQGKAAKCDYCVDRIEAGLDPACVTGCTGKALSLVRA